MALRTGNASPWLLVTLNPQSTCRGSRPGPTLAPWCSGGLSACLAESTRKDLRPGEKKVPTCKRNTSHIRAAIACGIHSSADTIWDVLARTAGCFGWLGLGPWDSRNQYECPCFSTRYKMTQYSYTAAFGPEKRWNMVHSSKGRYASRGVAQLVYNFSAVFIDALFVLINFYFEYIFFVQFFYYLNKFLLEVYFFCAIFLLLPDFPCFPVFLAKKRRGSLEKRFRQERLLLPVQPVSSRQARLAPNQV